MKNSFSTSASGAANLSIFLSALASSLVRHSCVPHARTACASPTAVPLIPPSALTNKSDVAGHPPALNSHTAPCGEHPPSPRPSSRVYLYAPSLYREFVQCNVACRLLLDTLARRTSPGLARLDIASANSPRSRYSCRELIHVRGWCPLLNAECAWRVHSLSFTSVDFTSRRPNPAWFVAVKCSRLVRP
jgi:hypothetical protein